MKKILALLLVMTGSSFAATPSMMGGQAMNSERIHKISVGVPSVAYEQWKKGNGGADIGFGGELVYADWAGEYSEVDFAMAGNFMMRWGMDFGGNSDVAFLFKPGAMWGKFEQLGTDLNVFGVRAEVGLPISVDISQEFKLITGVVAPITVMFYEDLDELFVLPILGRIGAEFAATETVTPFAVLELGPTFAFSDGNNDSDFGFRFMVGASF